MKSQKSFISPLEIDESLIDRYTTRAPRYTSYPTAPHFKDQFDRRQILESWRASNAHQSYSLYLHIPFCKHRCAYCGCTTELISDQDVHKRYLERVQQELNDHFEWIDRSRSVVQVALGGGTPNAIALKPMSVFLSWLFSAVNLDPLGERSIELDPRRLNFEYIDMLIEAGFNRFSMGVQDLNPTVQKQILREMQVDALTELVDYFHHRKVYNINMDLIYGLPSQTVESFSKTIEQILMWQPSRIALFGYAHVPHLHRHQSILESYGLPNALERTRLSGNAFEQLVEAGYIPIGMDHFAMPSDPLAKAWQEKTLTRNFMGYTTYRGVDLLGIGSSAISGVHNTYTQNLKHSTPYMQSHQDTLWMKGLWLTQDDVIRKEVILDLFCNGYLDMNSLEKKYEFDFYKTFATELNNLKPFEEDRFLTVNHGFIEVTELGRHFIRNICTTFDVYYNQPEPKATYSKTL